MPIERIQPPKLSRPVAYSHIAKVTGGSIVFIAGQISVNRDGQIVGKGDFLAQAEQVFQNVTYALEAAGADWSNVVKVVTYIPGYNAEKHRPVLAAMREKYMAPDHLPVSTLLGIQQLANPDYMIEVDVIAVVD